MSSRTPSQLFLLFYNYNLSGLPDCKNRPGRLLSVGDLKKQTRTINKTKEMFDFIIIDSGSSKVNITFHFASDGQMCVQINVTVPTCIFDWDQICCCSHLVDPVSSLTLPGYPGWQTYYMGVESPQYHHEPCMAASKTFCLLNAIKRTYMHKHF